MNVWVIESSWPQDESRCFLADIEKLMASKKVTTPIKKEMIINVMVYVFATLHLFW